MMIYAGFVEAKPVSYPGDCEEFSSILKNAQGKVLQPIARVELENKTNHKKFEICVDTGIDGTYYYLKDLLLEEYIAFISMSSMDLENISRRVKYASKVFTAKKFRGNGIMTSFYCAMFEIIGHFTSDYIQFGGDRSVWKSMTNLGSIDLIKNDFNTIILEGISIEDRNDKRVWVPVTDKNHKQDPRSKYLLFLKSLNSKGKARVKKL